MNPPALVSFLATLCQTTLTTMGVYGEASLPFWRCFFEREIACFNLRSFFASSVLYTLGQSLCNGEHVRITRDQGRSPRGRRDGATHRRRSGISLSSVGLGCGEVGSLGWDWGLVCALDWPEALVNLNDGDALADESREASSRERTSSPRRFEWESILN